MLCKEIVLQGCCKVVDHCCCSGLTYYVCRVCKNMQFALSDTYVCKEKSQPLRGSNQNQLEVVLNTVFTQV